MVVGSNISGAGIRPVARAGRSESNNSFVTRFSRSTLHHIHSNRDLQSNFEGSAARSGVMGLISVTKDASTLLLPHVRRFTIGFVLTDPPAPRVLGSGILLSIGGIH